MGTIRRAISRLGETLSEEMEKLADTGMFEEQNQWKTGNTGPVLKQRLAGPRFKDMISSVNVIDSYFTYILGHKFHGLSDAQTQESQNDVVLKGRRKKRITHT